MVTPLGVLATKPARPSAVASRQAKGRKPTPWTAPRTSIRTRWRRASPDRPARRAHGERLDLDPGQEHRRRPRIVDVVGDEGLDGSALGDGAGRRRLEMLGEMTGAHVAEGAEPHRNPDHGLRLFAFGRLQDLAHQVGHQGVFMHGRSHRFERKLGEKTLDHVFHRGGDGERKPRAEIEALRLDGQDMTVRRAVYRACGQARSTRRGRSHARTWRTSAGARARRWRRGDGSCLACRRTGRRRR